MIGLSLLRSIFAEMQMKNLSINRKKGEKFYGSNKESNHETRSKGYRGSR